MKLYSERSLGSKYFQPPLFFYLPLSEQLLWRFWYRGRTTATAEAAKHFVESFTDYLHSIITEADDRDNNTHHTIETYLETRRENIGARPAFVPGELHLAIPDDAFYHPVVKELEYLVTVLIIIDNVSFATLAM